MDTPSAALQSAAPSPDSSPFDDLEDDAPPSGTMGLPGSMGAPGSSSWPRPSRLGSVLRVAARRKDRLVFLEAASVWAFETSSRLSYVHSPLGSLDVDVSLAEIEGSRVGGLFVRVHKSWLANLSLVKALRSAPGGTTLFIGTSLDQGIDVPVARDRARAVRETLLATAVGIRKRSGSPELKLVGS